MLPAATGGGTEVDAVAALGPFAAAALLGLAAITWLIRDRARIIADRDHEREVTREQSERLVAQAERSIPVLERTGAALEAATRAIDRQERTR